MRHQIGDTRHCIGIHFLTDSFAFVLRAGPILRSFCFGVFFLALGSLLQRGADMRVGIGGCNTSIEVNQMACHYMCARLWNSMDTLTSKTITVSRSMEGRHCSMIAHKEGSIVRRV